MKLRETWNLRVETDIKLKQISYNGICSTTTDPLY